MHVRQNFNGEFMPTDTIREEIIRRLRECERMEGVRILMAIESGSRAWGFPSPNSDYDVRFIYARDKDWYLSINVEDQRDVIEFEIVDDIDLNGWDLRKALRLLGKSNPVIAEWLQSPIVYAISGAFKERALQLLPDVYAPEKGIYHYRSMAKTSYRTHLCGEVVSLKKYFYALRPVLAVKWIEVYGSAPPIEFQKLLPLLDDQELLSAIEKLLEEKMKSAELAKAPAIPILNRFLETELQRLETFNLKPTPQESVIESLNSLFQTVLAE